ncbi:DUF6880 family protein [Methylobacterium flocculans]|uniref:DUF6880 family protein n=1 Tax=Methylobacterium flocculans TaxID=2984843 RepID=UPI0021F36AE0|nr:DUF6880 family protein [Methylobacterium sp. FF17]
MARRAAAIPGQAAPRAKSRRAAPVEGGSSRATDSELAPAKPKRASRRTTPSPETLTELGLERLIGLVLDEVGRNTAFKKLVTAAVASLQGSDAVAALIDRRLTALERAGGFIDWQKRRAFGADLDAMVTTVVNELAPLDARGALDRLIRFLAGAGGVLGRTDDSTGRIQGIYERAAAAAATLILDLTDADATAVALSLVKRLETDPHGLVERLLNDLSARLPLAALGPLGAALAEATPPAPTGTGRDRDWIAEAERGRLLRMRQALADRAGDVDAFIALETERDPKRPDQVLIAERLLAAGREREALKWIRRSQKRVFTVTSECPETARMTVSDSERVRIALEIRIQEAVGNTEAAQDLRWQEFVDYLNRDMLRAYLAKLPDFEDDAALERAFGAVEANDDPYAALDFYTHWPAPARAARLVAAHPDLWEGFRYEFLVAAAEVLEQAHPREATILYRHVLDDILSAGRSNAYGHAARYLATLDHLACRLEPGAIEPAPEEYRAGLRRQHGRKAAFWSQVRG